MKREFKGTVGWILRELCLEDSSSLSEAKFIEMLVNEPVEPILHCLI